MSLAWPAISKSFAATGRAVWRDEAVDIGITFSDFAAALRGERTGLKVRLAGAPMKFAFDGTMSARPTLKDRRRAVRRHAVAAPCRGLDRPEAVAGRRLRALLAQGADECGRRHDRADRRQSRARRQSGRRRADLCNRRPPDLAGHAGRRLDRSHALSLDHPAAHRQRARMEPRADRARWACRPGTRSAAVGRAKSPSAERNSAAPRSPPTCAAAS